MTEDDTPRHCGEESDDGHICTRPAGHDGPHKAIVTECGPGWEDHVVDHWEQTYDRRDVLNEADHIDAYLGENVDVDWDAYYGYAEQEDNPVAETYVSADLFVEFAEEVAEQSIYDDGPVTLTATRGLPLIAKVGPPGGIDRPTIALAPRVRND